MWFNFQCAVDQVGSLIVQAVCHVEIGLGYRIRLVEIDRRFAAERIFERAGLCKLVVARQIEARRSLRRGHFDRVVDSCSRFLFDDDKGLIALGRRDCLSL